MESINSLHTDNEINNLIYKKYNFKTCEMERTCSSIFGGMISSWSKKSSEDLVMTKVANITKKLADNIFPKEKPSLMSRMIGQSTLDDSKEVERLQNKSLKLSHLVDLQRDKCKNDDTEISLLAGKVRTEALEVLQEELDKTNAELWKKVNGNELSGKLQKILTAMENVTFKDNNQKKRLINSLNEIQKAIDNKDLNAFTALEKQLNLDCLNFEVYKECRIDSDDKDLKVLYDELRGFQDILGACFGRIYFKKREQQKDILVKGTVSTQDLNQKSELSKDFIQKINESPALSETGVIDGPAVKKEINYWIEQIPNTQAVRDTMGRPSVENFMIEGKSLYPGNEIAKNYILKVCSKDTISAQEVMKMNLYITGLKSAALDAGIIGLTEKEQEEGAITEKKYLKRLRSKLAQEARGKGHPLNKHLAVIEQNLETILGEDSDWIKAYTLSHPLTQMMRIATMAEMYRTYIAQEIIESKKQSGAELSDKDIIDIYADSAKIVGEQIFSLMTIENAPAAGGKDGKEGNGTYAVCQEISLGVSSTASGSTHSLSYKDSTITLKSLFKSEMRLMTVSGAGVSAIPFQAVGVCKRHLGNDTKHFQSTVTINTGKMIKVS